MSRDLWHLQNLAWQKASSESGWNPVSGSEPDELHIHNSTRGVEIKGFWKCWKLAPKLFDFLAIACTDIGKKCWKGKKKRRVVLKTYKKRTVFRTVSLLMLRLVGKLDFLYLSPKMSIKEQDRSWDAEVKEWPRLTHSPQTTKTWRQERIKICPFSKKINQCGKYFHVHFKPEINLVWKKAFNQTLKQTPYNTFKCENSP